MVSLNRITIIGYLTETPQVRQIANGTSVTDLNIKTIENITKEDGSPITISTYHNVNAWRRLAEIAGDYCRAGSPIYICGRVKTDSWETEDGQKRYKTKIIADDLILLESQKNTESLSEDSLLFGCVNTGEILGNVTKEPELRQTTNGQHVATIRVATNRRWQDRNSGEQREETEYHAIVVWGELAKESAERIKTGAKLYARGRMQTRSWETPDGEKRYSTELVADKIVLPGGKNEELAVSAPVQTGNAEASPSPKKSTGEENPDAKIPEIPEIKYESDIKPEDLPF